MPRNTIRVFLFLVCTVAVAQEYTQQDNIPLPAARTDAAVDLRIPGVDGTQTKVTVNPLTGPDGKHLEPQPIIKVSPREGGARLDLSGLYFWDKAQVQVVTGTNTASFTLERGPTIGPTTLDVSRGKAVQLWVVNHETAPLSFRWLINSGMEIVCGLTTEQTPKQDCAEPADWSKVTIPPAAKKAFFFKVPDNWFFATDAFREGSKRDAHLDLHFGDDEKATQLTIPLTLVLRASWTDVPAVLLGWLPPNFIPYILRLLKTILLTSLGAAALMLAQVILPGFRKCLKLESQLDALHDRFTLIGSRVGTRLQSRCIREMKSVRTALLMKEPGQWISRRFFRRMALFCSAAELDRLTILASGIETRILLTEKLDQVRFELEAEDPGNIPITILWKRDEQIRAVETILGRQFISDTERKAPLPSWIQ